jgi:hypothetical protein
MKELKVGERIIITLDAVERNNCEGCFFDIQEGGYTCMCKHRCCKFNRSDDKNIIFKEVKVQKRKMKEDKYSLKISRNYGDTTLDGYPIATYSNDELKILKNLITKVLGEVNQYIEVKE